MAASKNGKRMGAPTKYSDAIVNAICDVLAKGNTRTVAARLGGISYDTFLAWLETYPNFVERIARAESEAESAMAESLRIAAMGLGSLPADWRAAESWLKRRRRDEWGDNVSVRADKEVAGIISDLLGDDESAGIGSPAGTEEA